MTPPAPFSIWYNYALRDPVTASLRRAVAPHRLVAALQLQEMNAPTGLSDPSLAEATVAFGQAEIDACLASPRLRWVQVTSAGFARFDTAEMRQALQEREVMVTTSSAVYAEPCAQHLLAMMLAHCRQLPWAVANQLGGQEWPHLPIRAASSLLEGQTVLLVGFGSIARRIAELLHPFHAVVTGMRRSPQGDEPVPVSPMRDLHARLEQADHVVNILPTNPESQRLFGMAQFAAMKPGAVFYNIGRGTTVDHAALVGALQGGRLQAAYLDVTDPEPLPARHPLWLAPRCFITPHAAGGHATEQERLVAHFLNNLHRFSDGKPLIDRVI